MKKKVMAIALACLLMAPVLAGCGGSGNSGTFYAEEAAYDAPAAYEYDGYWADDDYEYEDEVSAAAYAGEGIPLDAAKESGAKIIYTASLDMETTEFDDAMDALEVLVIDVGGYFESSTVSEYGNGMHYASCTVRVPAENYRAFMDRAGDRCRVKRSHEYTEDVSEYYYDTSGRLDTQKTKLKRLQELLAEAEDMVDILTIEDAISETEERIDRLSGELRHYDALVDYSTVTVSIDEVERLSNVMVPADSFGTRLATAFRNGWEGFLDGLEIIAIVIAHIWLWLIFIGVIVAVIVLLSRRGRKRREAKRAARAAAQPPAPQPAQWSTPSEQRPQPTKDEQEK